MHLQLDAHVKRYIRQVAWLSYIVILVVGKIHFRTYPLHMKLTVVLYTLVTQLLHIFILCILDDFELEILGNTLECMEHGHIVIQFN